MLLVSACLAGLNVRYDASNKLDETVRRLVAEGRAVMVCPEMLGGLTTPREPAEIVGGHGQDVLDGTARVMTQSGIDVTAAFLEGAYRTLEKAQSLKAAKVVLKEYSPSCGSSLAATTRYPSHFRTAIGMSRPMNLAGTGDVTRHFSYRFPQCELYDSGDGFSASSEAARRLGLSVAPIVSCSRC